MDDEKQAFAVIYSEFTRQHLWFKGWESPKPRLNFSFKREVLGVERGERRRIERRVIWRSSYGRIGTPVDAGFQNLTVVA